MYFFAQPKLKTYFSKFGLKARTHELSLCDIWSTLDQEGYIPEEIKQIEVIEWNGQYKNLQFISENSVFDTLLVDDQVSYIDPNQINNCISISCWDYHYHSDD